MYNINYISIADSTDTDSVNLSVIIPEVQLTETGTYQIIPLSETQGNVQNGPITWVQLPNHGTLVENDDPNTFEYISDDGFEGLETIIFRFTGVNGEIIDVTIQIWVEAKEVD